MKRFKFFRNLLAVATAVTLGACSSDAPDNIVGDTEASGNGIYSQISFRFPGTRSTASEGNEIGQDYENNVGSILVVMADKDETSGKYKFISFALNDAPITNVTYNTYTITFQDKESLYAHAEKTVYIFAYCNPTEAIRTKIAGTFNASTGEYTGGLDDGEEFTDETFSGEPSTTWQKNGFLMTSVDITEKKLPTTEELKTYNTPTKALNLGTVEVIRTMSRFDFRDAAPDTKKPLEYTITNTEKNEVQGSVKFTRAALFNVSKSFYYLPRIGNSTATTLCPGYNEMEVSGENSFVISPTGRTYSESLPASIDPLNPTTTLKWTNLNAILGMDEDKDDGWGETITNKEGYRIWTYASENTFGPDENSEENTTGYVFEAEIITKENFGNVNADGTYETMYLYGQTLYPNALAIANAVEEMPVSTLATAFNSVFDVTRDSENKITSVSLKKDESGKEADVTNVGFTAYKPNKENKYLCYYFAFNCHNDNTDPTTIGPMEFATVRNNVYKLAVTKVKKFGTFTPPTNVEEWDTYFTLDVQVKNWVVRVNNIEF